MNKKRSAEELSSGLDLNVNINNPSSNSNKKKKKKKKKTQHVPITIAQDKQQIKKLLDNVASTPNPSSKGDDDEEEASSSSVPKAKISRSAKKKRHQLLISRFHALLKRLENVKASTTLSPSAKKEEISKIEAELDSLGGIRLYQKMSVRGENVSNANGNTCKWIMKQISSFGLRDPSKKLKLLDVGALHFNYPQKWIECTAIDLNPNEKGIQKMDFLKIPLEFDFDSIKEPTNTEEPLNKKSKSSDQKSSNSNEEDDNENVVSENEEDDLENQKNNYLEANDDDEKNEQDSENESDSEDDDDNESIEPDEKSEQNVTSSNNLVPISGLPDHYDIICLSLVVNFVGDIRKRGLMLLRSAFHLALGGHLFMILPLPCIDNSRYFNDELLIEMFSFLGFKVKSSHKSKKLCYFAFEKIENHQSCIIERIKYIEKGEGSKEGLGNQKKWKFARRILKNGEKRNNFTIVF